jgi:hypothetical protein
MKGVNIVGYLVIGGKMFIVGVISGVILWLPTKILGLGVVAAADASSAGTLMGLGIMGVALFVAGIAIDGYLANKIWKWR